LSTNKYIRFVDLATQVIKESRIPLYSCKYSKKTYNQHQLLLLILLKEYIGEDYRDTVELMDLMNEIKGRIQLNEVPHFTTLQKFSQRISSITFNRLLNRLVKLFYDWVNGSHARLLIRPDLPVRIQVNIIPGEPVKQGKDS